MGAQDIARERARWLRGTSLRIGQRLQRSGCTRGDVGRGECLACPGNLPLAHETGSLGESTFYERLGVQCLWWRDMALRS